MKIIKQALLLLSLSLLLAGCGESKQNEAAASTIKVGTMGTYNPFSYVDENGQLTGFDIEVLREVSRRDPTLQFEFIASPWDTLFPGLDADRFQLLANQITETPARKKRYYLSDNHYFTSVSRFIVSSNRNDLKSAQDLKGKKVGLTIGDAHTLHADEWNEANGHLFESVYYESDLPSVLQDIENGRIDATVNDIIVAKDKAKVQGLKITIIGENIISTPAYFIFKQDPQGLALKNRIDNAIKSMRDDGTLANLSIKWFGEDFTG